MGVSKRIDFGLNSNDGMMTIEMHDVVGTHCVIQREELLPSISADTTYFFEQFMPFDTCVFQGQSHRDMISDKY
jgi:hypothetical protein